MTDRLLGTFPDQIYETEKEAWLEGLWWRKKGILDSVKENENEEEVSECLALVNQMTALEVEIEDKYPDLPPDQPIVISEISQLSIACPTQFEGLTDNGLEVYVRYRWGHLTVEIDNIVVFSAIISYDGTITYEQVIEATKGWFIWPGTG